MIEPTIEALTTSCSPAPSAKRAMMSSGALPKVTLSRPPIPGPERTASSSVARPMSAAVGMTPSAEAKKVTTAPACASSRTIAIGMKGTSRYGQPWLVMRNRSFTEGGGDYWPRRASDLHGARGAAVASAAVRRPPVALLATVLAVLLTPVAAHAQAPRTVPSELDALLAAGAIDQLHHDAWAESYDNAKATLKKLHGTRRRQLDAVIANTRAIAKAGLLTATPRPARLPHPAAQPRLVVGGAAAALRPARDVRGQPARVAVLPRAGDPGPVAGHLRPRQRALPADGPRRRAARPARRGARPGHRARRRHRLGVALPLRRRRAAVGQRPLAGHGAAGPLARGGAPGRAALLRGRARRAGDLPRRAAGGRARRHPGRRALPAVLLRSRACTSSTASSRRSTGSTTSRPSPTTPRGARSSRPARRRRASSCRPSTPARGRCTSPARRATSATTCSCATSCARCASASPIRRSTAPRPTGSPPTCASRPCSP